MLKQFAASAVVASLAVFAPMQSQADTVTVSMDGIGAAQCTKILANLESQPSATANAITGWTYGYMTRRNMERAVAKQNQVDFKGDKITQEKVLVLLIAGCKEFPDRRLYEIADASYEALLQELTS
jgi:hypothetical protein